MMILKWILTKYDAGRGKGEMQTGFVCGGTCVNTVMNIRFLQNVENFLAEEDDVLKQNSVPHS